MEERSRLSLPLRVLAGLVLIAYPVLVWRGLASQSPRTIALVLLVVLTPAAYLRLKRSQREGLRGLAIIPLVTVASLSLAGVLDSLGFILIVPVAINSVFLATFGATLRSGSMPMIERFARLQEESLSAEQQAWCKLWTQIWCAFFVFNATTAAVLAGFAPLAWWAFYNGLLAYGLSGALLGTEWLLRRRRFPAAGKLREEAR